MHVMWLSGLLGFHSQPAWASKVPVHHLRMKTWVPREEGNSLGWVLCPEQLGSLGHKSDRVGGGEIASHAEGFRKSPEASEQAG